jgi:primosomal protein N' (replication factor Y)
MPAPARILRVAVNTPLRRLFDYLPPSGCKPEQLVPGLRLRVPFGKSKEKTGLLAGITGKSEIEPGRLKRVTAIIDNDPLFGPDHLQFLKWASDYYHHPVGEVMLGTLPVLLGNGSPAIKKQIRYWRLVPGKSHGAVTLVNAPVKKAILNLIKQHPDGIAEDVIRSNFRNWRKPLSSLAEQGWIESFSPAEPAGKHDHGLKGSIRLNTEQQHAVETIIAAGNSYKPFLLHGITGSGKTEVYLHAISACIKRGFQALVLLPEIALTPQFIERFRSGLNATTGILHSGLTDRERMDTWLGARDGSINIIIGTRSAIWTPFRRLGIIVVDEEHDLSYKQQEGFRYSARDLALYRAHQNNIPVILGSATPSLESLQNVADKRYQPLTLTKRTGTALLPDINILDIRRCAMDGALSMPLMDIMRRHLEKKQQVLLFLNRRGYAPVMMCHDCGWIAKCPRCNIQMTCHKHIHKLCCHHCQHQEKIPAACPQCSNRKIIEIGHGTQRLTETLEKNFPDAKIMRIDRDSTRRKGVLQSMLEDAQKGNIDILTGTQMLAKGHHFPGVTLVGIIDADRGLYSADFRASERMAQIIMQVSGRAGRADNPGTVVIQTHHPDHPLLTTLAGHDYTKLAMLILEERRQTLLPPFSYQVLLRAEASQQNKIRQFLDDAYKLLPRNHKQLQVFGPVPAPIEKRAGNHRMQLLVQMPDRRQLRKILDQWVPSLENLPGGRKVRWSLDIDPQDML